MRFGGSSGATASGRRPSTRTCRPLLAARSSRERVAGRRQGTVTCGLERPRHEREEIDRTERLVNALVGDALEKVLRRRGERTPGHEGDASRLLGCELQELLI